MQIQTTTITTETMNVVGANLQVKPLEQKIAVFCDCCDREATGTKSELRWRGWELIQGAEFCPMCD